MDAQMAMTHNVVMTKPADRLRPNPAQSRGWQPGFTLVELLVASSIAALLSTLTWTILIENTKGNVRAEFRRRLHEDWNQATTLIQSEISMSDLITSTNITPNLIPNQHCQLLQDSDARLKLRMHLVGTLPEIIYGTRTIASLPDSEAHQWMGNPDHGVLIRCGPKREIGPDGKIEYRQGTYQQSILLDNLDLSEGDGLEISQATDSEKLVEFSLSMNEAMGDNLTDTIRTKRLSSRGLSRINEVQHIPADTSSCQIICQSKDVACGEGVKTLLSNDDRIYLAQSLVFGTKTICTNRSLRLNDGVIGANGNYVIDGNPTPKRNQPKDVGVTLEGGSQRNILLGTPAEDILFGGPDHDGLIGRGGNDEFYGNAGNDNMVPWTSAASEATTVTINGGDGFDRVYLKGVESSYTLSCSGSGCTLQSNAGGTLILSNVELLVFKTSSNRLVD